MKNTILILSFLLLNSIYSFSNTIENFETRGDKSNNVLIINLDYDSNSADAIYSILNNYEVPTTLVTIWPESFDDFNAVFVCLGIFQENTVLNTTQGQELADYLNAGGNLYLEGGDTWFYDPPTPVHPMFGIEGFDDGWQSISALEGTSGAFTSGMFFDYADVNFSSIDNLNPLGDAFTILQHYMIVIDLVIAHDAGNYKTIGSSVKFGSLVDGTSTKEELLIKYMEFFGVDITTANIPELSTNYLTNIYPNPSGGEINIEFEIESSTHIQLDLYNSIGQHVLNISNTKFESGLHHIKLNTKDYRIEEGIYEVKIETKLGVNSKKIIVSNQ